MKFGRYLLENQTPEWKRAYIDYRAAKKAIKVVALRLNEDKQRSPGLNGNSNAGQKIGAEVDSSGDEDYGPSAPPKTPASVGSGKGRTAMSPRSTTVGTVGTVGTAGSATSGSTPKVARPNRSAASPGYGATSSSPRTISGRQAAPPPLDIGESSYEGETKLPARRSHLGQGSTIVEQHEDVQSPNNSEGSHKPTSDAETSDSAQHLTSPGAAKLKLSPNLGRSPRFLQNVQPSPKQSQGPLVGRRSLRSMTLPSPRTNRSAQTARSASVTAQTMEELYDGLEQDEQAFFDLLQRELEKVESFYRARETDAIRRSNELKAQLKELAEHRRIFHELYPNGLPEWEAKVGKLLPGTAASASLGGVAKTLRKRLPWIDGAQGHVDGSNTGPNGDAGQEDFANANGAAADEQRKQRLREEMSRDAEHHTYNPERYSKYKRELRLACQEFYRQLELVKNYRIMNLTGFRKALKKFEKATNIHCMELYTDERIQKEKFAKGEMIDKLLQEMEQLFTEHFEHGDSKRARERLRRQQRERTHYFSVFRSGICLGLALPPAILAIVKACEDETRALIPGWQGLLQVYGGFYIAVIFALLFQVNLHAYVSARINYEFVMELSKPTLDYRSYAEIPAFLFLTLSYCFFFTFYRVSPNNVDPSTWPLAWLIFVIVFFLNPLAMLRRNSRFWLLKVLFGVVTPGFSKVDFITFFLADELNSLTYTIQNFYFIGCTYAHHWPSNIYTVCPSGKSWPYAILLCLPAFIRLVQCVKRWHTSKLGIHLINAGKYLSSIAQYVLFVIWRARGRPFADASFIVWVLLATASSTYTSVWDLVIDWSLFRPNAKLLRRDKGYSNTYVYYFAMITNVAIRFVWIWYLPVRHVHANSRSFIFAVAEMLRRWQWNFFRVETEHLGNADAYRVTREIPLPYRRVEHESDEDDKFESEQQSKGISSHWKKIKMELVGKSKGRGPDEVNAGPRGHERQREYEARRPGDTEEDPTAEEGNTAV